MMMAVFEIEQYELHAQKYQVKARNEAEAIAKLLNGEARPVDDGLDYVEVAEDYGLAAENHHDLAAALQDLGISVCTVIPSIRCISKV
jgi:hypothetical protein